MLITLLVYLAQKSHTKGLILHKNEHTITELNAKFLMFKCFRSNAVSSTKSGNIDRSPSRSMEYNGEGGDSANPII